MRLVTSETIPDRPIEQGDMVYACAVSGANILRDMREAVINTIGGHMTKYEALLDQTIARALEVLSERARQQGYDGVLGIRISHPTITSGAIEVVVAGTGFRYQGSGPGVRGQCSILTPDPCPPVTHKPFAVRPVVALALAAISRAGQYPFLQVVAGLGLQGHRGRTNLWL